MDLRYSWVAGNVDGPRGRRIVNAAGIISGGRTVSSLANSEYYRNGSTKPMIFRAEQILAENW